MDIGAFPKVATAAVLAYTCFHHQEVAQLFHKFAPQPTLTGKPLSEPVKIHNTQPFIPSFWSKGAHATQGLASRSVTWG